MRSRIVRPREMRETFGTEVREFPYAFVLPTHAEGWEAKVLAPASLEPIAESAPRRRAGDKQPLYIDIKPKP